MIPAIANSGSFNGQMAKKRHSSLDLIFVSYRLTCYLPVEMLFYIGKGDLDTPKSVRVAKYVEEAGKSSYTHNGTSLLLCPIVCTRSDYRNQFTSPLPPQADHGALGLQR